MQKTFAVEMPNGTRRKAARVDREMVSAWWILYHRAHLLLESSELSTKEVFERCQACRDYLFTMTGTIYVPDEAPEGAPENYPSVETSVMLAYASVRWLEKNMHK